MIQELGAIVTIKPEYGEGEKFFYILRLFKDTRFPFSPHRPLFSPAGGNIDMDCPQWATVSASRKPGRDSSHWLVRIGICFRSKVPGFVVGVPCLLYEMRTGSRSLSMVEGDIFLNALMASKGRKFEVFHISGKP
jgi:hypothetical protein